MRPEKESMVAQMRDELSQAEFLILADYRGLTVEQTETLRDQLHQVDATLRVTRNRLLEHALDPSLAPLAETLDGPRAMVLGRGDVVETAKVVKIAALDGAILSAEDVQALAALPPRQELLGKLVGTLAAPMSQLVGVLQQKAASLVYVLQAVREKKEAE